MNNNQFLYEKIQILNEAGLVSELPTIIESGLSKKIKLRPYQIDAYESFVSYFENEKLRKNKQIHNLFHMATGSGKTVIMAGLILYLYTKGYRKFLFFVNQTNVLEKTIDNFINNLSNKYLFDNNIEYLGNKIKIKKVDNFSNNTLDNDIEIVFTTTQKLHLDLFFSKENAITYDDFENNKVVFISDESHHINSLTKKPTKDEQEEKNSWEYSVMNAFNRNKDNVILEFTATCDLKDTNVLNKYKDKIIFNYPLVSFRQSGYTKDFQNLATDTDLWTRTLIALVISEYRKFLFTDLKLNIKPVLMLKSQKIAESRAFYDEFFKNIKKITTQNLFSLIHAEIPVLNKALQYFKEKDNSLELLVNSIQNSFTKETSIIMNGSEDNNKTNQLLVNSLEDTNNPIRLIFAVDMLNEGWDVLNLFDIVRLYDTRQGSGKPGKVGTYTIKEAQLIGRGARYCPFIDEDEELKFVRKYDNDLTNDKRILETMFFHSKNDSKYIFELRQALIETGLQSPDPIKIEYKLKHEFKESDFFENAWIFSNKKEIKSRKEVKSVDSSLKNNTYYYKSYTGKGNVLDLFNEPNKNDIITKEKINITLLKIKEINLNILLGASEFFNEFRFDFLKAKYPTLKSKQEFFTSDDFLGNIKIEISYLDDHLSGREIFRALKKVLSEISTKISLIKPEYKGSKTFEAKPLKNVIKDKTVYLEKVENNGGKGASQNESHNQEYQIDLNNEQWYVFNDNYGTSEEKLFIKYFKTHIEPKLKAKDLEYYLIRNERFPELAIYSFDSGERFEPDFVLFCRKKINNDNITYQTFIEPKGAHLLEEDKWKEEFLNQISNTSQINNLFFKNYKIIGLPFFNSTTKVEEFNQMVEKFINQI
ncbi:DEAD/DEAH box helicase family protein [Mycoplasmopsis felis]|uniref:DEAD/DEAH box helicase family protein n=2 Tax=Mycoplasmopsis felis TaxID=33923 RepID=UPI002AFF1B07|nr:DEAD/DEAH box helicase family protein [Mycoplasmopsis felis]WQQ07402.1 DEAD/DEAH box helicase family protein [Mycoplasmopsis felis]